MDRTHTSRCLWILGTTLLYIDRYRLASESGAAFGAGGRSGRRSTLCTNNYLHKKQHTTILRKKLCVYFWVLLHNQQQQRNQQRHLDASTDWNWGSQYSPQMGKWKYRLEMFFSVANARSCVLNEITYSEYKMSNICKLIMIMLLVDTLDGCIAVHLIDAEQQLNIDIIPQKFITVKCNLKTNHK